MNFDICYPFARTEILTGFAKGVSFLGDGYIVPILFVLLLCLLVGKKDRLLAVAFAVSAFSGNLLKTILKELIRKPRPEINGCEALARLQEYSLPSGHVVFYTIVFGLVSLYAFLYLKGWKKFLVFGLSGFMIVSVGFSRLYLGVHYLSDVLAGFLLGLVVVAVTIKIYNFLKEKNDK